MLIFYLHNCVALLKQRLSWFCISFSQMQVAYYRNMIFLTQANSSLCFGLIYFGVYQKLISYNKYRGRFFTRMFAMVSFLTSTWCCSTVGFLRRKVCVPYSCLYFFAIHS